MFDKLKYSKSKDILNNMDAMETLKYGHIYCNSFKFKCSHLASVAASVPFGRVKVTDGLGVATISTANLSGCPT